MNIKLLFTFLFINYGLICFSQTTSGNESPWKFIYSKVATSDSSFKSIKAIKIITPTSYSVIIHNLSDADFQNALMGILKMDSKNYTEVIFNENVKSLVSISSVFTYNIATNKWDIKNGTGELKFDEESQLAEFKLRIAKLLFTLSPPVAPMSIVDISDGRMCRFISLAELDRN